MHGRVLAQLDDFVAAPAFEEVCQQWLRGALDAASVGWWWGKVRETRGARLRDIQRELDAVAIDDDGGVMAVGSCKWTAGPLPYAEKAKLEVLGSHLAPDRRPPQLYLFARNGFDEALAREAESSDRIQLISPEDLFPARAPAGGR